MRDPVTARMFAGELLKTYGPGLAPPCSRKFVGFPAPTSSPCRAAGGPALTRFEKDIKNDLAKFARIELSPGLPKKKWPIPCSADGAHAKPSRGAQLFLSAFGTPNSITPGI